MTEVAAAAAEPNAKPGGGTIDRLVGLLAPPIPALGGPWTLAMPLLLVFMVSLLASAATWAWAAAAPAESGAALLQESRTLIWVLSVLAPVAAALKAAVFAAMAWGMLVLFGGSPKVRPVLSTLLYGEAILALQALWITVGALALGRPAPGPGGALPVASGLDAFVGSSGGVFLAIAQQVTPFHLAWLVFLSLAFAAHGRVSRGRGVSAALILWSLGAALAVLRISAS